MTSWHQTWRSGHDILYSSNTQKQQNLKLNMEEQNLFPPEKEKRYSSTQSKYIFTVLRDLRDNDNDNKA